MKDFLPIVGLIACTANPPPAEELLEASSSTKTQIEKNDTAPVSEPIEKPVLNPDRFIMAIDNPETLLQLDENGYSLLSILKNKTKPRQGNATLFSSSTRYRHFVTTLGEHIEANRKETLRPLVIELQQALKYPAGNVGRAFDIRWLKSDMGEFELTGIINRFDRRDMSNVGHCGEIRLLYRLAYQDKSTNPARYSRLPMTLNAVMVSKEEKDCHAVARRWAEWSGTSKSEAVKSILKDYVFSRLEVNAQISRYPSGLETEFAGQAVYLLQVYKPIDEKLVPIELENTPDVTKIKKNESLRKQLIEEINNNIDAIDAGTHRLSKSFLATEALSYSTNGLNRLANKPYDILLGESLELLMPNTSGKRSEIKSAESLIERLNNSTCMGCHQSQSTAGFHWLGHDRAHSGVTNRIAIPFSAHFHADQERRQARIVAEANGESTNPYRAHAAKPPNLDPKGAKTGENCIPNELLWADGFGWGCKDQRDECRIVVSDPRTAISFGTCIRKEAKDIEPGMACREGTVSSLFPTSEATPFNRHAYADTFRQEQLYGLPEKSRFSSDSYNCRPTRIGVPLGRAYRKCTSSERRLENIDPENPPGAYCAIVGGAKFDQCVEKDFHSCLSGIVGRGMLDACHKGRFCREDYICQELPHVLIGPEAKSLASTNIGFCTPTYFLFQLRLDGHPTPL